MCQHIAVLRVGKERSQYTSPRSIFLMLCIAPTLIATSREGIDHRWILRCIRGYPHGSNGFRGNRPLHIVLSTVCDLAFQNIQRYQLWSSVMMIFQPATNQPYFTTHVCVLSTRTHTIAARKLSSSSRGSLQLEISATPSLLVSAVESWDRKISQFLDERAELKSSLAANSLRQPSSLMSARRHPEK